MRKRNYEFEMLTADEKCRRLSKEFNGLPYFEKGYIELFLYLSENQIYKYGFMMSRKIRDRFFDVKIVGHNSIYSKKKDPVFFRQFEVLTVRRNGHEKKPATNKNEVSVVESEKKKFYEYAPNYKKKTEGKIGCEKEEDNNHIAIMYSNRLRGMGYSGVIEKIERVLVLKLGRFEKYSNKIIEKIEI
jgi:hypothetical protein